MNRLARAGVGPVLAICLFATGAAAAVHPVYVSEATGFNTPGGGSMAAPFKSIGYALSQVSGTFSDPVELRVARGTYNETITLEQYVLIKGGYEEVGWTRDIELNETRIDGGGASHVVLCSDYALLDGFTITGGNAEGVNDNGYGGGIYCDGTSPIISNCLIAGNHALWRGGAVYAESSSINLIDNLFIGNSMPLDGPGNRGAALFLADSGSPVVTGNIFADNQAYWTSALDLLGYHTESLNVTFDDNIVAGNVGAIHLRAENLADTTWTNNLFTGNVNIPTFPNGGTLIDIFSTHGPDLVNNTFIGVNSDGVDAYGSRRLANNILAGHRRAVVERSEGSLHDIILEGNLFHDDAMYILDEAILEISGANEVNLTVGGASGNVEGDPGFGQGYDSYPWTADGVYDAVSFTTTLTDSLGCGGGGNSKAGWLVNPDITQDRQFLIKSSTATELVVWGDASAVAQSGDTYSIKSWHLTDGGAAIDRGSAGAAGLPATDLDGDARPGDDYLVDIGCDETPAWWGPPDDLMTPISFVTALPTLQSTLAFDVPFMATDNESGVYFVELYYREGDSGPFTLYPGAYTSSPILFTAPAAGRYQFYTRAHDNDGNVEAAPASPDAETRVLTSFAGDVVYVDDSATGSDSGQSWADALSRPSEGLLAAAAFGASQVWVAEGTYIDSIALVSGVSLYGGFQGTESSLEQRDPASHESRIDGNGATHVVLCADDALLDGFTITGGSADRAGDEAQGGGIFCDGSSPTISGCLIAGNYARRYGAGIYAERSSIRLLGNRFVRNTGPWEEQSNRGAGAYIADEGEPVVTGNLFTDNLSRWSSAIQLLGFHDESLSVTFDDNVVAGNVGSSQIDAENLANTTWTNNLFAGNVTVPSFTGGGSLINIRDTTGPDLVNNTLTAVGGEGIDAYGSRYLANNIFAGLMLAVIERSSGSSYDIILENNLFFGNATDVRDEAAIDITGAADINSLVGGASGNVDGDPAFVTGYSFDWTADGSYDALSFTTTLTDAYGVGGAGNGLAGWLVNPDITQERLFVIKSSSATELVVWGDASAIAQSGDIYSVESRRIQSSSGAFENGLVSAPGLPAADLDGEPRPGADGTCDIGCDEFDDGDSDGFSNGLDNCPLYANPDQSDSDADGHGNLCDCANFDDTAWETPGEVRELRLFYSVNVATAYLTWLQPEDPGGTESGTYYDVLRSPDPSDFMGSATCLESDDGSDLQAADTDATPSGETRFYLVRADNACPGDNGFLGYDWDGLQRLGRSCP